MDVLGQWINSYHIDKDFSGSYSLYILIFKEDGTGYYFDAYMKGYIGNTNAYKFEYELENDKLHIDYYVYDNANFGDYVYSKDYNLDITNGEMTLISDEEILCFRNYQYMNGLYGHWKSDSSSYKFLKDKDGRYTKFYKTNIDDIYTSAVKYEYDDSLLVVEDINGKKYFNYSLDKDTLILTNLEDNTKEVFMRE